MREIWFAPIFIFCLTVPGCRGAANYPVDFVDRSEVFVFKQTPNPLLLVIEIDDDGRLSLNKIEIGMIDDRRVLAEKLAAIFDDRKKSGLVEREVIIAPQGKVKSEDLEKLIESLVEAQASPIRVIKSNL